MATRAAKFQETDKSPKATKAAPKAAPKATEEEFETLNSGDGDGEYAPTHDFETSPVFRGTLTGSKEIQTKHGMRTKYTFDPADGYDNGAEVWGSTIVDEELAKVDEGTRCQIIFKGKQVSKSGNNFNMFEVGVSKGNAGAK